MMFECPRIHIVGIRTGSNKHWPKERKKYWEEHMGPQREEL